MTMFITLAADHKSWLQSCQVLCRSGSIISLWWCAVIADGSNPAVSKTWSASQKISRF